MNVRHFLRSLALVCTLSASTTIAMDRVIQIRAIQQGEGNRTLSSNEGQEINYTDVDRLLCPIYALNFAWQLAQNHTKAPDALARILSDRDYFNGLLKWFAFLAPQDQRATPAQLVDISGDRLHERAQDFLTARGDNGFDCFNRLIVHGAVASEASRGEIEAAFTARQIPYMVYILNTTEAARQNLRPGEPEIRGRHWVTLLVRRNAGGQPEFIAANSIAGDVKTYEPVMHIIRRLSGELAAAPAQAAAAAAVQQPAEDDEARIIRESREAFEQQQREQDEAVERLMRDTGAAHQQNLAAQEAEAVRQAQEASRAEHLAQGTAKHREMVQRDARIRELIQNDNEAGLENYLGEITKGLDAQEIEALMMRVAVIRDSVEIARERAQHEQAWAAMVERDRAIMADKKKTQNDDDDDDDSEPLFPRAENTSPDDDDDELAAALRMSEEMAQPVAQQQLTDEEIRAIRVARMGGGRKQPAAAAAAALGEPAAEAALVAPVAVRKEQQAQAPKQLKDKQLKDMTIEELEAALQTAIREKKDGRAAIIREWIKKK